MTEAFDADMHTGLEIAIIGMDGRFPGAPTLDAFWRNLRDGVESISFFSDEELRASGVDSATLRDPQYVRAGAILDDIELFDAPFFGYSPREAEVMDPQQRVFLECAWAALEHAGYDPERYAGSIGVYAGVSMSTYFFNLHADYDPLALANSPQILLGNGKDYLATRVSYKLNLDGPSVSVQTACSTALVAVHMAARALLSGECDMALAGAVSINVPQKLGYRYQEEGVHSPDGHCRAFDAQAQGTVFGNGAGVVVLKRLADAIDDGDTIHAVILGTAINNDGSLKVGYTAPSVEGQFKAITAAQRMGEIDPATISYVETHGTGTPLGDPIEIAALTQAFAGDAIGRCAIGSVKTNIGHTNVAAGVAGLIKTVLALQHRQIPPSLHYTAPNPNIDFANSPFYVNASLKEWRADGRPLRAGVSSFGLGGTNAHAIVEEAPPIPASGAARAWQILPISARSASALDAATDRLAAHLRAHPEQPLADVAYTLQVGRRAFAHRRILICCDRDDALAALESGDSQRVFSAAPAQSEHPVVFMFPGGGAQYAGMGRDLYESEPAFRAAIDECAAILRPRLGFDLRAALYPADLKLEDQPSSILDPQSAILDLTRTGVALPALFMVEYAMARLLMSWGVQPDALIGHSLGEYVAATLAGVFALDDALALVLLRGQLIERLPSGAMISVALSEDDLRPLLGDQLDLAAINGPALCVVSGPTAAVDAFAATLHERGVGFRRIKIAAAGHSQMIEPILDPFTRFVAQLRLSAPEIPYISNVSGTWITAAQATDPRYWADHLRRTVRFAAGLAELLREPGRVLLEVGPGQTLTSLARMQLRQDAATAVASMRQRSSARSDAACAVEALGQLWLAGAPVDWQAFSAGERRMRVPLPTYPFERQRYWIDPPRDQGSRRDHTRRRDDVGDWFYLPSWKRSLPPAPLAPGDLAQIAGRWLIYADAGGVGAALAQRVEQAGGQAISVRAGARFAQKDERDYVIDPRSEGDYAALVRDLREQGRLPEVIVHCWSADQLAATAGRARFEQAQERGYYSLLYLCHALADAGIDAPLRIVVASRGLHSLTDEPSDPEQAALLGPCLVIPQEYPQIACRSIDIGANEADGGPSAERLADKLLAEVAADAPDRQVAYRGAQRWVRAFEQVRIDADVRPARAIRERGVYVITGGLGNVGLLLAKQLARTVQARLALIGRSGLPPRDAWAAWLDAHDPREVICHQIRSVQAIEALGSEVLALGADVADEAALRAAIERTEARFGPINGVIHAAGITSGDSIFQPIAAIGRAESEAQFQPKAYGLYALERALGDRALDFRLLISSNAAILGGLGLIAYAAANLFMDAFAAQRGAEGAGWISANWDGWPAREDNRLAAAVSTSLDQYAMAPDEAVDAFERIVTRATAPQIAVSAGDLPARVDFWVRRAAAQQPAGADQDAPDLHPRPELQSSYVAPRNEVERALAEVWQALLGIDEVGVEDDFFRLGGHSLLATQLMSRVRDLFQVALPVRSLFEGPTVAALAARVTQALAAQADSATPAERERSSPAGDGPRPRPRNAEMRALPVSFAQRRLWFLDQLEPGNPFYNDAAAVRLRGALNLAALQRSIDAVARRHESLRTTFAARDGEPAQVIAPARRAPVAIVDLRGLTYDRREPALLRLAGAERLRGFNLARGPLLRITLLRLDDQEHALCMTMHHIVADAWSMGILIGELATLYAAFAAGRPDPLPDLPIQYADFAIWQRERIHGSALDAQLAYWRDQLAGSPPLLDLPTDRPRPTVQSHAGATYTQTLPRDLADALNELSRREGCTLFMTLLATFQLLLSYASGQTDLVVGTNVANRNRTETERLIGFFVNMLVLRADLSGDPTFRELIGRVRETTLSAYAHQDLPFEQLVAELRPVRSRSYAPLFQVVFTLQNAPLALPQMPGLEVTPLKIASRAAKYDLVFNIAETEQGLEGTLEYDTALFDAATIGRMVAQFEALLRAVVERPGERLSALADLLPELERRRQLDQAKDFQAARLQKFKQVKRKTI